MQRPFIGILAGNEAGGRRWVLWLYLVFLALCFLGGGGSRSDILSLLYLRPAAVLCAAAFLVFDRELELRAVKVPLMLLGALALIILVQLIPLPPEIWTRLPGHGPFVDAATVAQMPQPWRPISIAPDLTLNSLASLVVPFAALIGFAALSPAQRYWLLGLLIAVAAASALLGVAQLLGGETSPFYLYRVTNGDSAVGLFSNRNHQAALLAMTYPVLAVWAAMPGVDPPTRRFRSILSVAFGLLLVPLILVTGSRGGLVLGVVAVLLAGLLYVSLAGHRGQASGIAWKRIGWFAAAILVLGAAFALLATTRAVALQRLFDLHAGTDLRVANFPVIVQIARDFFPLGSGFGTFDPAFRLYEPMSSLDLEYLNQAHNDLLELAMTGGLLALLVLGAFLLWFAMRTIAAYRGRPASARAAALARLGAAMITLLFVASVVDYPLRTPIMAALFAIACGWLSVGRDTVKRAEKSERWGGSEDIDRITGLTHSRNRVGQPKNKESSKVSR